MSIIFVDQVGSTARADGADPEDVRDRNRLFYEEVRGRIERHGGLLEKYAGDAVMAVFGVPLARSNDAESAVRAGLSVLEGIRRLNALSDDLDLEVRVGVCTGEAVVEIDAPPESALATGDVVNTAARLEASAPPGAVIVGTETYRLTRHAFRYRALPDRREGKEGTRSGLDRRGFGRCPHCGFSPNRAPHSSGETTRCFSFGPSGRRSSTRGSHT